MIETEDLAKTFRRREQSGRFRRRIVEVEAVASVSFRIEPGELVGYIGPNGAGKSTTIKMLTGILQPTSGLVKVAGLTPLADRKALARRIGVVFGQRSTLWWDLPLSESFELLRHIYRVPAPRHRENVARFVELLDVQGLLLVPVRQLSLGQRMRGEIVAALLHDPDVLFLDEPTIGLDIVSKHAVRSALAALQDERGVTVVLTTHDLADVEELCRRILIIDHGRVIYDGSIDDLKHRYGDHRVLVVDLHEMQPPIEAPGLTCVRVEGPRQWMRFSREDMTAAQALERVAAVVPVRDLTVEEPEIEEIVRRIYAGEV
jgi:ABC-2 type transport system ATP-binding protein